MKTGKNSGLALASQLLTCLTTLVLVTRASAQDVPAINLDPAVLGQMRIPTGDAAGGWSFRVRSRVTITGLGFYDAEGDGLSQSHLLGLWQSQSTNWLFPNFGGALLVASATIPSGQSAQLDGVWRKATFDVGLTIEPGIYAVAASYSSEAKGDPIQFGLGSTLAPYIDSRIQIGSPGGAAGDFPPPADWIWLASFGADLGPMFFIQEVPEPSPLSLLFAAALLRLALPCVIGVRTRRQRR